MTLGSVIFGFGLGLWVGASCAGYLLRARFNKHLEKLRTAQDVMDARFEARLEERRTALEDLRQVTAIRYARLRRSLGLPPREDECS